MKRGNLSVFIVLVLAWLTGAGCAFGTRNVNLTYPPKSDSGKKTTAQVSRAPTAGIELSLVKFDDQRSDKRVIGEVRNGWGMHTADVVAINNVQDWFADALKKELDNAGYDTEIVGSKEQAKKEVVVSGEIVTIFCTALMEYEPEVSFFARVQKDGKELLNKRYTGKKPSGLNMAATSESYGQALSVALRQAIFDFIADLNRLDLGKNKISS